MLHDIGTFYSHLTEQEIETQKYLKSCPKSPGS